MTPLHNAATTRGQEIRVLENLIAARADVPRLAVINPPPLPLPKTCQMLTTGKTPLTLFERVSRSRTSKKIRRPQHGTNTLSGDPRNFKYRLENSKACHLVSQRLHFEGPSQGLPEGF